MNRILILNFETFYANGLFIRIFMDMYFVQKVELRNKKYEQICAQKKKLGKLRITF